MDCPILPPSVKTPKSIRKNPDFSGETLKRTGKIACLGQM